MHVLQQPQNNCALRKGPSRLGLDPALRIGGVVVELRSCDIGVGDVVDVINSNEEFIVVFLD